MARRVFHSAAWVGLLFVAAAPLGAVIREWAGSREALLGTFADPARWGMLARSLGMASVASLGALAMGGGLACLSLPIRGRWLLFLSVIPLLAPPTVYGLGWNAVWRMPDPDSHWIAWWRCAAVMALAYAPLILVFGLGALRWQDTGAREAARLAGMSAVRRWVAIEVPSLAGPLSLAAAAVLLLAFSQFEIPSALNYTSFPEEVYAKFVETYAGGPATGVALLSLPPTLFLTFVAWRRIGRRRRMAAPSWTPLPVSGGALVWAAWIGYLAVAVVVPAFGLARRGFNPSALRSATLDFLEGMRATIPVSLAGMALCMLLAWPLADLILARRRGGLASLCLAVFPATVAPALIGIGIIRFWNQPHWGGLVYGRSIALALAMSARFLAVGVLACVAARIRIGRDFQESASVAGISEATLHCRLLGPACAPLLWGASVVCLVLMMGELGATTLLSAPGTELLSYRLLSRVHIGPESFVAALSSLYAGAIVFFAGVAWATWARLRKGGQGG